MGDQFGDDDHVAGLGGEILHSFGHFGAEIVVVVPVVGITFRIEIAIIAREIGLVRTGHDDEPAVAGVDVGQVKETHQVVVV